MASQQPKPGSPGWSNLTVVAVAVLASRVEPNTAGLILGIVALCGLALEWFSTRK
ncbi:hypothetical protein KIM372_16780 [Bombiscardovia nodaiensis]|uniref:Uncharacterized protein n=1 Tax=Bombiscardovia nodaiensis TaxID=2932181 RepID=A0ABM8BA37_9BIFI|nr:hypothetical protein KIM372_16780 [Bombiscardovia nodaiensis]